ncbi:hypothetical protein V5F53_08110 [Xanthobacter sp. V4C-4]|uniref:hypothetical protein n=1 Tax=Xanthobacter cornucopiae TaxID=3119924 RepID=UPI003726E8E7
MLYALVLIIHTTTYIQQFTPGPDWPYQVGSPYYVTQTAQQVVAYYQTERACRRATGQRTSAWPPPREGQRVQATCIPVEAEPPPVDIFGRPLR